MTTINLKRYYPYMTENVILEVSDEIAAALSMGGRLCDSYKRQKRRNGECSLDTDPGFEADVLRQRLTVQARKKPGCIDADHPVGAFPAECCVVQRIVFS